MVDLRAPDRLLSELGDARRRLKKGAAAPVPVRDRLVELADALADSGPLELGVSPRRWVRDQGAVNDLASSVQRDPTGPPSAARAKAAIDRLRRLMRLAAWSSRWRVRTHGSPRAPLALFALAAIGLAGLTWLIESLAHGQSSGRWLLPALPIVTIFFFASLSSLWRAREAAVARNVAAKAAPGERHLAYCRMPRAQLVIATDTRVLAVNLRRIYDLSRPLWTVPYAQITAIQPRDKKHGEPMILRTTRDIHQIAVRELLATSQDSYDYQRYHHEALLRILSRRTQLEPAMAASRP